MVIGNFVVNGTEYVVIKMENAAHVISKSEWKTTYGKLHPERWI